MLSLTSSFLCLGLSDHEDADHWEGGPARTVDRETLLGKVQVPAFVAGNLFSTAKYKDSLSPSLSQIHCKSKWINPRPQSDKTSRLQENWCQNSCHQANCTKLSTSLRRRSLILVREICEENRICHLCGKVAITEQRARPTTSPIHRRTQVCNAVLLLLLLMLLLMFLLLMLMLLLN